MRPEIFLTVDELSIRICKEDVLLSLISCEISQHNLIVALQRFRIAYYSMKHSIKFYLRICDH